MYTNLSLTSCFLTSSVSFFKPEKLILTILLLVSITGFSQRTHIPDVNFREVLQNKYNITADASGNILNSDAIVVTSLNVQNKNIASLIGIEAFTALTDLNCSSNQLTNLDVSANTDLTSLVCGVNQLTNLGVSANTALTYLNCHINQLTSLDVSANTDLTYLVCGVNLLTSLDVSANTSLIYLNCKSNQLTSLNVKNRNNINFREKSYLTFIGALHPIADSFIATSNPVLKCIEVDSASYSITNWSNKDATARFSEDCNAPADTEAPIITLIGDNPQNIELGNTYTELRATATDNVDGDISVNIIIDTSAVDINSVGDYSVTYNVSDTAGNPAIQKTRTVRVRLDAPTTPIPDGNFEDALITLGIDTNGKNGNILNSDAIVVTSLNVQNKNIASLIGIEAFTALTDLNCSSNQLTNLDVSANTTLTYLNCHINQLTSLDVSANTDLTYLVCGVNLLTSLDVSANTSLIYLNCKSNQLTSLNVKNRNNINFREKSYLTFIGALHPIADSFIATSNPVLKCIEVDSASYSITNWPNKDATARFSEDCNAPADTEAPIITLIGDNPQNIELGNTYTELRATATDNVDGDISVNIIIDTSAVDINSEGSYSVTYNVSDTAGNPAIQKTRTVRVRLDAPTTPIPDGNFEDALITLGIDTNGKNGNILNSDTIVVTSLNVQNKNIASLIGIEAFTALTDLNCSSNQLTNLDVSANTALTYLNCHINQLTSLDVSANTDLTYLVCGVNLLTSLDVSANASLIYLNCKSNQLTSLNVKNRNNINFREKSYLTFIGALHPIADSFIATSNPVLKCIEVDSASYSITNWPNKDATARFSEDCNAPADTEPPIITLIGDNPQNIELGNTYTELRATATDNVDGDISVNIIIDTSAVDINSVGDYSVTYNVSDTAGNSATQKTRTVRVMSPADTEAPIITLIGDNPQNIELGNTYTELRATATDNVDGDISVNIRIDTSAVDINSVGDYSVTYNVSDTAGNPAIQKTRTVRVRLDAPTTPIPDGNFEDALITLGIDTNGKNGNILNSDAIVVTSLNVQNKNIASLIGIEAFTALTDLNCSSNQLTNLDVSANTTLTYLNCHINQLTSLDVSANTDLTYLVCGVNLLTSLDVSANTSLIYLNCKSNQLTSLNVKNRNNINFREKSYLTFIGALHPIADSFIATSNPVLKCIEVDSASYSITNWPNKDATARFSEDCNAPADTEAPIITLIGDNPQNIELGNTYTELRATATDNVDGDISVNIIIDTSAVDINSEGSYSVTYNVSDTAGNPAIQKTRTVRVRLDAPTTPIPDGNFEDALITLGIDTNGKNGNILNSDTIVVTSLNVQNKNIASLIGIEAFTALTDLNCSSNQLTNLDVSANTALTYLNCHINQLTSLDVSANTDLTYLVCGVNLLTSLDVSANASLIYLNCKSNQLTSLNVKNRNNINFREKSYLTFIGALHPIADSFIATSNPVLKCIEVDSASYSITNWPNKDATARFSEDCNAPADIEPPIITLIGDNPQNIELGNTYTELRATATDNVDGDISVNIIIDTSAVDINSVGDYSVTYNVSDTAGNPAIEVIIIVNVVDTVVPVITLHGLESMEINQGDSYTDAGAEVIDNDPAYSENVIAQGDEFDTNIAGSYIITYSAPADDSKNNPIQKIRTVVVEPVIATDISVFPNPTNKYIHIDNLIEDTTYILSNIIGQIFRKGVWTKTNKAIIDVSSFAYGIYLLSIKTSEGTAVKKIIKIR